MTAATDNTAPLVELGAYAAAYGAAVFALVLVVVLYMLTRR